MNWKRLLKNPYKYYKVQKRAKIISQIRYQRLWEESILGIWSLSKKLETPFLDLFLENDKLPSYNSDNKITFTIPKNK